MKDKRKNKNVEEMQDGDQCIDKQCQVDQNVKPKITTLVFDSRGCCHVALKKCVWVSIKNH